MKKDHNIRRRFLAFLLSAALIITYMPTSMMAYAAGEQDDTAVTEQAAEQPQAEEKETADKPEPAEPAQSDEPAQAADAAEGSAESAKPDADEEKPAEQPGEEGNAGDESADEQVTAADPDAESAESTDEESEDAEAEAQEAEEEEETEKPEFSTSYTKKLTEVDVEVKTAEDAFDEEVVLVVKPLDPQKDKAAVDKAEKALAKAEQTYSGALFYDIHFESKETGKEVEPKGPVSVDMKAKKSALKEIDPSAVDLESLEIVHIGSSKTEVVADTVDKKDGGVEGKIDVDATDSAVKSVDATFEVDSFSTFALTWGDPQQSATIHFVELNEDGSFTELDPEVSLDTDAASVSLATDFPDAADKEYRFVAGYYSETATTELTEDVVNIEAVIKKNDDGEWVCDPVLLGADPITVANGSHIYASYKEFTKAGHTPATGDASKIKPDSIKNVTDNHDGTYTIRLDINGHQFEEKKGANVLLVFDRTSSMLNDMGSVTRLAAAKGAVHTLVNALDPDENPINMAVMSFARNADANYVDWTTSGTAITNFTDGLQAAASGSTPGQGGTNWEAAFDMAKDIINDLPDADKNKPTYLVFLTDGNPTIYVGSNTIRNATATSAEYTRARASAAGINSGIPIYGILCANANDGPLLNTLMTDLASSGYGSHETHYVLADNEATLTSTFQNIGDAILSSLGANQASTNDGVTALSTTSATAGAAGAFKYYKTPRPAGMEDDEIIPQSQLQTWSDPPAASYSAETGVTWDLESVGVLEDNTSYTLEFTVWPSQAAYDLIADLNNGLKDYDSLDDATKAQVYKGSDGKYYLRTNTNFDTTYNFQNETYNDDGITQSTGNMVLPTETIDIEKIWNNFLDQQKPPKKAILHLTKDGENYLYGDSAIEVSASDDPDHDWKAEVFISLGQILQNNTDKSYEVLETGHDYEIIEPPELNKYQWELHSEIFRPMVINGDVVMLIKDDSATGTDGVDYYTIGGTKYKKDTGSNSLKAWNDRRSWLQVEKKVEATTPAAPADTLFEYTVKIVNSGASAGSQSDTSSDYYVWFSAFDGSSPVMDLEVSSNVTAEEDESGKTGYFYVPSRDQFTVKIKAGWTLRFLNLPSGSTYDIQETNLPDGFTFVKAEDRQVVDTEAEQDAPQKPTISGDTVTGTINVPNVEFYVDYTNKYEETTATFTKQWDDASDQDGIRPSATEYASNISLLVNGTASTAYDANRTITDNGDNTYTITYTKLPKYIKNTEAKYQLKEDPVPEGYTVSGSPADNGGTIKNSHTPKTTNVEVEKVWNDNNDQDGKRPENVVVTLLKKVGDTVTEVNTVTLSEDNDWKSGWDALPVFEDGVEIVYTIVESAVDDYVTTYSGAGDDEKGYALDGNADEGYSGTVTNTHNTEKTTVTVTKVWDDANDQDGIRPESISMQLSADGTPKGDPVTLNEGNNWSYTWEDLNVYYGGEPIEYKVDETAVPDGYTEEAPVITGDAEHGFEVKITNKHEPETTTVKVTKVWEDADDQDGIRPESIDMQLSADGTAKGDPVTLNEGNSWTYTWEDLPVNADGKAIKYTVDETEVPEGYSKTVGEVTGDAESGFEVEITNTHEPKKTTVKVTKVWSDNDDQDGIRPESIDMQLSADGTAKGDPVTLKEDNSWTYTWEGLDVYKDGEAIEYTVDETAVPTGYTKTVGDVTGDADSGFEVEITNTHTPDKTTVKVTKVWDDEDDQDGIRPDSISMQLYADGTESGDAVTLNEDNSWTYTWEGLDVNKDGEAIAYTVDETAVPEGYSKTVGEVTGDAESGFEVEITNKHEPETTTVTVTKVWSDNDDQDGIRPDSIDMQLSADGTAKGDPVTLNEGNSWTYKWENLPVNAGGKAIEYTVDETAVPDGYTKTIGEVTGDAENGFEVEITNTHTPDKTTVKVTKVWDDNDDQDGKRPESINMQLYADGTASGDAVTLDEDNSWTYTWEGLDVNKAGVAIEYTVDETAVPDGYTKTVGEVTGDAESGFEVEITNKHEPKTTKVDVTKVWDDNDDQDGVRPDEVVVTLLKKVGDTVTEVGTVVLDETNQWTAGWDALPVFEDGVEIVYTILEDAVAEYTTTYSGAGDDESGYALDGDADEGYSGTVTNRHEVKKTTVKVTKVWSDNNDQDGKRPDSISMQLYADGTESGDPVTLNEANNWTYTWRNLDVNKAGEAIEYTVDETAVPEGYTEEDPVITGDAESGFEVEITNVHEPEKTKVTVTKVWDDEDDQDGIRPESIDMQLSADGTAKGDPVTLNEGNSWTYTWENLDVYKAGEAIEYTVDETEVPTGYTKTVGEVTGDAENGFEVEITNTHEPKKTTVKVTKVWDDANDQDGKRPESIDMQLYADGTPSGDAVTLNEGNNWTYTWEDLDVNKAGVAIEYTVDETAVPEGYTEEDPVITGDADTGFEVSITNVHEPKKTTVKVTKVWNDDNDHDKLRPKTIDMQLFADGTEKGDPVTLDEGNSWTYTWNNLDAYKAGEAIEYTVDETAVPDKYSKSVGEVTGDMDSGYEVTITNTHQPDPEKDVFYVNSTTSIDGKVVQPGEKLTYKINYTNVSENVTEVVITDTIPEHTQYVMNSMKYTVSDNDTVVKLDQSSKTLKWSFARPDEEGFAIGTTFEATFDVEVLDDSGDVIPNQGILNEGGNKHETNIVKNSKPHKDVFKQGDTKTSIDGKMVKPGDKLTYEIKFTNTSKEKVEEIVITDKVPAHTKYVEASAASTVTGGSVNTSIKESDGTITWTFKQKTDSGIPRGTSFVATFDVEVLDDAGDVIENQGKIQEGKNNYDTNVVKNSKPHKEVLETSSETKIDGKKVEPGQELTYSITYTNANKTAQEVTITDNIPEYTSFVSADKNGTESGGTVTWDLGSVEPGDSVTVSFIVKVDDDATGVTIKNKAKVREGENESDTNEVSNFTPVMHDPPVLKELEGDEPDEDETFLFKLTAVSSTTGKNPMPEGSSGKTKTIEAEVGTPEEFGDIVFDEPGEYDYTITEVNTGLEGYTYDKTVYKLHYTLTLDGDTLNMDLKITKNGKTVETPEFFKFVNEYDKPDKPKTGDNGYGVIPFVFLGAAAALGAILFVRRRKRQNEEE